MERARNVPCPHCRRMFKSLSRHYAASLPCALAAGFTNGPAAKRAAKRTAEIEKAQTVAAKKQKALTAPTTPAEIIAELVTINKLPYAARDDAKRERPEWFEFCTNYGRSSREVRKKANELLYCIPGVTKTKLCEASAISSVGLLTKFLENKGAPSAEESLSHLIDILEGAAEGDVKRRRRLQSLLKMGTGHSNLGERVRWAPDKLKRFRDAFPGIEVEFGDKPWQVMKK